MKKVKDLLKTFNWFEWFMILAVIIFTIYFAAINTESTWWYILIDSIAAITGIFCVVLCAKGKKGQYVWGLFNVIGYIVIAWINRYWGEVMLNGLYYLPSQFVGFYLWNKHMNEETKDVEGKKMTFWQTIIFLVLCTVGILLYKLLLDFLQGNETLLDSASTVISVIANALMMLRYREQWLLWIIIDIITVAMWVIAGDFIMVTMWGVYLINAFYGYYKWTKMANLEAKKEVKEVENV